MAFRYLQDKTAVTELFDDIATKVADRPGGYTRILKIGTRAGDAAEMVFIELVDYNEGTLKENRKKARRSRRSRKGAGGEEGASAAPAAAKAPKAKAAPKKAEKPADESPAADDAAAE